MDPELIMTSLPKLQIKSGTTVQVATMNSNLNTKTWGQNAREFKLEYWLEPLPFSVLNVGIPSLSGLEFTQIVGTSGFIVCSC